MRAATRGRPELAAGRPLPQVFDRMVLILTGQAHLFALLLIASSWDLYLWKLGVLLAWLFSMLIPVAFLVVAQRSGGLLSPSALAAGGLGLLLVDVAGAVLVKPADLGSAAMWTWGVVGVTVLTLAPFRPVRDILLLGAGHGLVILVTMGWAISRADPDATGTDGFRLLADLNAGLLPALAAAQFVQLYVGAIRARERAAAQLSAARASTLAADAVQTDTARRLAWLRAETVPLLAGVADGTASVSASTTRTAAQLLSRDLRRELLEGRTGVWLLDPEGAGAGRAGSTDVLDPQGCLARLADPDRAALVVFLDALREHAGWRRLSVAFTPSLESAPQGHRPAAESATALTVVAMGPAAPDAAVDLVVLAAAQRLRAGLTCESGELLVADATMSLTWPDVSQ